MNARPLLAAALLALLPGLGPALARAELFPPPGPGPLGADPAAIRVEITLPDGVTLLTGSATLSVESGSDKAEIPLSEAHAPVPVPLGARHVLAPTRLGASALGALQSRQAGTAGPQAVMGVAMALCRTVPAPADTPFALTVRLSPAAPALPLALPGTGLSALTGAPPAMLAPCR